MRLLLAIAASIAIFVADGMDALEDHPILIVVTFLLVAAALYVNRDTGKKPQSRSE